MKEKCCKQKYSGIGGQAVLEGIMMRNGSKYAVAVRTESGEIKVKVDESHSLAEKHAWLKWPFIRGVVNFVESLKLGVSTLMYSSEVFAGEDVDNKDEKTAKQKAGEGVTLAFTLIFSLAIAIGLFSVLPTVLAKFLDKFVHSWALIALAEGLLRLAIFIIYVWAVSLAKDIKRTYMYHGSEHKCINCIEHGLVLNVENVRASSKEHKRCGTSFMLIIMVFSILIFMFMRIDNIWLRVLSRIVMIPVIASLSYEFLRIAGTSNSKFINILSRPGMWLQGLTTKEPDDDMIEVAIRAVEAVFDWREFLGIKEDTKSDL